MSTNEKDWHWWFTKREVAIVLAALRLLQEADGLPAGIQDILTDGGTISLPTKERIDILCEHINTYRPKFHTEEPTVDELCEKIRKERLSFTIEEKSDG